MYTPESERKLLSDTSLSEAFTGIRTCDKRGVALHIMQWHNKWESCIWEPPKSVS